MLAGEHAAGSASPVLQERAFNIPDDPRRLIVLLSIAAFLFALCCLPTHVARLIVLPSLLVGAGANQRLLRTNSAHALWRSLDGHFLLFAFGWILASGLVLGMHLTDVMALLGNILLLVLLALLVRSMVTARLQVPSLVLLICFTVLGASLSIGADLYSGRGFNRLESIALNGLIIPAAGGYACAIIAAVAVWRTVPLSRASFLALGFATVVLLAALAWNQSRGPIVALAIALASAPVLGRMNGRYALVAACLAAFVTTSAAVLFEGQIHALFCADNLRRLCQPSQRLELWGWTLDSIAQHPLIGVGFGNYFGDEHRPHPHNGLLSLAFFAGLPFLLAFLVLYSASAIRLQQAARSSLTLYAGPALIFGFGYMGTDLANAVGFIGTHYLFIWIPIFTAYSVSGEALSGHLRAAAHDRDNGHGARVHESERIKSKFD